MYAAAAWLGIGKSTLYRAINAGQLPITVHRVGSRMMLPRRQIDAWLDSGQDPRVLSRLADPDIPTRRRDANAVDDAYDVADAFFRRVGAERS